MQNPHKSKLSPRELALRAARAATLGLALSAGCYQSSAEPVQLAQPVDAGFDVATVDTNPTDTSADTPNCHMAEDWSACCVEHDWDPNAGCAAWGPFVPPALGQVPSSRPQVG